MNRLFYISIIILLLSNYACERESFNLLLIEYNIEPTKISGLSIGSVTVSTRFQGLEQQNVTRWGYVWSSTDSLPRLEKGYAYKDILYAGANTLIIDINKLIPDTRYFIQPFVIVNDKPIYYNPKTRFRTKAFDIVTQEEIVYDYTKTLLVSSISNVGERDSLQSFGLVWSSNNDEPSAFSPTDSTLEKTEDTVKDAFVSIIRIPDDINIIYARAYTTYKDNIFYGGSVKITPGAWRQLSPFTTNCNGAPPGCLYAGVGFSIGKKGYVGLGSNDGSNFNRNFWEYDTENATWRVLSGVPRQLFPGQARAAAVAFTIGNKAYVGSGSNGPLHKDFYSYSPSVGWLQVDDLPIYLRGGVCFVIDNKAYVGGGYSCLTSTSSGCAYSNRYFEFDPTRPVGRQWREVKQLLETSINAASFSLNGKGYVIGGVRPSSYIHDSWSFDPKEGGLNDSGLPIGNWKKIARFPGSVRQKAIGFTLNNKGYIGTGSNDEIDGGLSSLYDLWSYNSTINTWEVEPNLGTNNRHSAQSFVVADESIGEQAYVYGGRYYYTSQVRADDFWVFTPID